MKFLIQDVFAKNGHVVFHVTFYNADDTVWHREHFLVPGSEGKTRGRIVDAEQNLLMDNDEVAPTQVAFGISEQYLPSGRDWKRGTGPYLTSDDMIQTFTSTYAARLVSGWPEQDDQLGNLTVLASNLEGVEELLAHFISMKGVEV